MATPPPLSRVQSALGRVCADLKRLRCEHALVGGLAVAVRTEPRFTRDADVAVSVADDGEAEALIRELHAVGYRVALKILARDDERRPQDRVDLLALRAQADAATWDLARSALSLITERRFNRGRDLLAALDQLRATAR